MMTDAERRFWLDNVICTAGEGGSNYWGRFRVPKGQPSSEYTHLEVKDREGGGDWLTVDSLVIRQGYDLGREAWEAQGPNPARIWDLISAALATEPDEYGYDIDLDADDADVCLQMALFSEVRFS